MAGLLTQSSQNIGGILPHTKSDYDWIRDRLRIITDLGTRVNDGGIVNEYSCHTALKLISVSYYSTIFSGIVRSPRQREMGYDGAVYVDLFAGSGLVKVRETGDILAGSTICAAANSHGFDYIISVEKDPDFKLALESRLAKVAPSGTFSVIEGDCNSCISEVVRMIKRKFKNPIVLAFVDPEGMEIKLSTLASLSKACPSTDFMINVTSGIPRVTGLFQKGNLSAGKTLEDYYNDDAVNILAELELKSPEKKYQEQIGKILGKKVGDTIPVVEKGDRLAYNILGYTRMTQGGSRYAQSFSDIRKRFRNTDGEVVRNILDQIHNRGIGSLTSFMS